MWETIQILIQDSKILDILTHLGFIIILLLVGIKLGLITLKTTHLSIGNDTKERDIIRQQVEWSHAYIMGLESNIRTDTSKYNGYFTKYILERVYDEVVDWITFNHINVESEYISIKQEKLASIIYGMNIRDEFKTPEFRKQMDEWTETLIYRLVQIRKLYK